MALRDKPREKMEEHALHVALGNKHIFKRYGFTICCDECQVGCNFPADVESVFRIGDCLEGGQNVTTRSKETTNISRVTLRERSVNRTRLQIGDCLE